MKQYKILATSITTNLNLPLKQGDIVSEDKFCEHLTDLLEQNAIEEHKESAAIPKELTTTNDLKNLTPNNNNDGKAV